MALSSIILGVIALLVSFSIFKDVSLILAAVGVVLGIVALVKKKSKAMSIIGIILAIVSLILLFYGNRTTTTSSNSSGDDIKKCKLGDTINVSTSSDEYTLKVTSIKETKERNEYADEKPAQVFLIDYTYVCNKTNNGLYLSDMYFKIIDEQGEIGYTYPIDTKSPQSITAGTTCKAQMAFGVNNKSKSIKLQFYDNMFNGNPTAIYEIEL